MVAHTGGYTGISTQCGTIFECCRNFHILDGITLEGEEFAVVNDVVIIDIQRSRTTSPVAQLEVLPDSCAAIGDYRTDILRVVSLVHILTLDVTPAVEIGTIVQFDMTSVSRIDYTTLTGGICRLISSVG